MLNPANWQTSAQVDEKEAQLTTVERRTNGRAGGGTRRRLTPDEQHEIARLYTETSAPPSEIRERFGIGESSVYRVLQKQGVSLRGRGSDAGSVAASHVPKPATGRRTRSIESGGPSPRRRSKTTTSANAAARQFRVRFEGQQVFTAQDVNDALRQAEARGLIDVFEVTRVD